MVAAAIIRASLVVVILLAALVVFVRWLEPRFAFFPSRGETTTPTSLGVAFTAESIDTRDSERLRAWRLRAAAPRARIVYFHGNGGNLSIWAPILSDLARHGFDVLAVDYRGYGLSTGRPTERGLYRDADAVIERTAALLEGSGPLIYWGRSLGTAVAAYAATRRRPDGIVLEAGFPDARAILPGSPLLALLAIFSTYRFDTAAFLDGVQAPVLVIHGDADSVVPFALGRALFDRIRASKTFVAIPGGDHNDARPADGRIYWNAVDAFVGGLLR